MIPASAGSNTNGIPPLPPTDSRNDVGLLLSTVGVGMTVWLFINGRVSGQRLESLSVYTRQDSD